jgi:hypothetical protein
VPLSASDISAVGSGVVDLSGTNHPSAYREDTPPANPAVSDPEFCPLLIVSSACSDPNPVRYQKLCPFYPVPLQFGKNEEERKVLPLHNHPFLVSFCPKPLPEP